MVSNFFPTFIPRRQRFTTVYAWRPASGIVRINNGAVTAEMRPHENYEKPTFGPMADMKHA